MVIVPWEDFDLGEDDFGVDKMQFKIWIGDNSYV